MADTLQWPNERKTYPGLQNPVFVSDIKVANQGIISAIISMSGMLATDFAILTGLDFVAGSPSNTYTPGVVIMGGGIYYVADSFNENLYLQKTPQTTLPQIFGDDSTHDTYTLYFGTTSISPVAGGSPQFTGSMNQYRIGSKYFRTQIANLLTRISLLGTASNANLGTASGEILTADQTYTQAQVNALITTRAPSVVGSIVEVYDPSGVIESKFDGTGLGISFPWLNGTEVWAFANGNNTTFNAGGVSRVGIGTFTNPDTSTKTFANNDTGGSTQLTLTLPNLPPDVVHIPLAGSDSGTGRLDEGSGGSATMDITIGGTSVPIQSMNPYRAVYVIIRIA